MKCSLHRIIHCRGFAESRGLPRIQNNFAEAFLHERICCNVISPGCLAIAANSTSKRVSILTSCRRGRSSAAGIPEQTSDRAVSLRWRPGRLMECAHLPARARGLSHSLGGQIRLSENGHRPGAAGPGLVGQTAGPIS